MKRAHVYLTALSPIEYRPNDPDGKLAAIREELCRHEQQVSPFRRCPTVHMARMQVIDTAKPAMGAQDSVPLQSSYLLLAAELDGTVDDFLDCLYRVDSGFVQRLWGRCIGYAPHEGAVFLRRYIARCRIRGELPYAAFDASVQQTLEAVALKERVSAWVADTQGMDPAQLRQLWQRDRRALARPDADQPGTF